ncbi:restriction endonuclease subunit S, partial [Gardnerella pickettii]|uniref:restriction endonuclease subunit S n=1 Tax=Gardnerella pickettii TaxID=2914924 RepID=UPI0039EE2BB7
MEELVDLKIGRTPPRKEQCWFKKTSGIKWASIKDIGNSGRFIDNTSEYITKEAVNKFNIPVVNKNTVILSFKLTVGKVSIAKDTMTTNEAIAQLPIKDTKILNPMFLYYYLKNYNFNQLGSTSSIATAINSRYLKRMILDIPSIYKQNKIVDILSSLDNAIENNEKINKNL